MASQSNTLGYIMIEGSEALIKGGALITDIKGFPLDFARTDPLRPDPIERALYGSSFGQYAKEKLILESLLDAMELEPQLWICSDDDLLKPLKSQSKIPAVLLEESAHVPLDSAGHIEATADPSVFLIQAAMNGNPLRAEFPKNTRPEEVQLTANILAESAMSMNILEPFARLEKALNYLSNQRS